MTQIDGFTVSSDTDVRVVVIAEDPLARAGLAAMLSSQPDCEVVGQLAPEGNLLDALEVYRPQVIVQDMGLDPSSVLENTTDMLEEGFPLVALIPDETSVSEVWNSGVRSILPRTTGPESLGAAVLASVQGLVTITPEFAVHLLSVRGEPQGYGSTVELTPRELEVLKHMSKGISNKSIAYALDISEHTVKFHVTSIMGKLGAQSRTEAAILATRMGLVPL